MTVHRWLLAAASTLALLHPPILAQAQEWPNKPVRREPSSARGARAVSSDDLDRAKR